MMGQLTNSLSLRSGFVAVLLCGSACGVIPPVSPGNGGTSPQNNTTVGGTTPSGGSTSPTQNGNAPSQDGNSPAQDGNSPSQDGNKPVANPNCTTVDPGNEIMISKLSVVEDSQRAVWHGNLADPNDGAWSFGRIMTNLAGKQDPSTFVLGWLQNWEVDQTINGQVVPNRKGGVDDQIITPWTKDANGKLDLTQSPLRLLAISNRLDLRQPATGSAGELRFIYEFTAGPNGAPQQFTVILEFNMPITAQRDAAAWANLWHGLSDASLDANAYNSALQNITDLVTAANSDPSQPNGSALFRIRTNEIQLDTINNPPQWELRQYQINGSGTMAEVGVGVTPDLSLNQSSTLASFVNQNANSILGGALSIPATFDNVPFAAASVVNIPFSLGANPANLDGATLQNPNGPGSAAAPTISFWNSSGITSNDARAIVSLNSCNGCHGVETNTHFVHIGLRNVGQASVLSGFLTGETVADPAVAGTQRSYSDLARRAHDMQGVLCSGTGTQNGSGVEARPTGL